MKGEDINPRYKIISEENWFGIFGKDLTTGETVLLCKISQNEDFAKEITMLLNDNKVSLCHAKDVIRDRFMKILVE